MDRKQYQKEHYEKNKEKRKEYQRQYRKNNKDKIKQYNQKSHVKKTMRISQWKHNGIISDNFDGLYEKYINTEYCELCSVKLTEDKITTKTTRCLDHDHETGEFRNILCHSCNLKLPRQ